jgi:hypothetical protein
MQTLHEKYFNNVKTITYHFLIMLKLLRIINVITITAVGDPPQ